MKPVALLLVASCLLAMSAFPVKPVHGVQQLSDIFYGPFQTDGTSTQIGTSGISHTLVIGPMKYAQDVEFLVSITSVPVSIVSISGNDTAGSPFTWTQRASTTADGNNHMEVWFATNLPCGNVDSTNMGFLCKPTYDFITVTYNSANSGNLIGFAMSGLNVTIPGVGGCYTTCPFDAPTQVTSVPNADANGFPNATGIVTTTPDDVIMSIGSSPDGANFNIGGGNGTLVKQISAPGAAIEVTAPLGAKAENYITRCTATATCEMNFGGNVCSPCSLGWEMFTEQLKPVVSSTAKYTVSGTATPRAGVSVRLRPLEDNSVWSADSGVTDSLVTGYVSAFQPSVLERYVSGLQLSVYPLQINPGVCGNLCAVENPPTFLQHSLDACSFGCDLVPRLSMNEYDAGSFNITSLDLLNLNVNPRMTIVSFDDWTQFNQTHTKAQVIQIFQWAYAQGWKGIGVNECGGFHTTFGYATWSDGCADPNNWGKAKANTVPPYPAGQDPNIKYTDFFIDFPTDMKLFAALTPDYEAQIFQTFAQPSFATANGFNSYMYPVFQGNPANPPYLWDSAMIGVCQTTMYQILLQLSRGGPGCAGPPGPPPPSPTSSPPSGGGGGGGGIGGGVCVSCAGALIQPAGIPTLLFIMVGVSFIFMGAAAVLARRLRKR